jgi:hypothetical protein
MTSNLHFCPKCGQKLSPEDAANFCPACGNPLYPSPTQNTEATKEGLAYQSLSFRPKKKTRFKGVWFSLTGLWAGFMVATAGLAIYPSLGKITDSFVCRRKFIIESHHYSYKPGQSGVTRNFFCQDSSGTRIEITGDVMLGSILIYSLSGAMIGLIIQGGFALIRILFTQKPTG